MLNAAGKGDHMPGIKTDTLKLNEAEEALADHCKRIREALAGLNDEIGLLEDSMYCSAVPVLKNEFTDKVSQAMEHISKMERHIEKLSVIAGEYEDTERRNTDESDSIDRG